jgi:hypothetical protein
MFGISVTAILIFVRAVFLIGACCVMAWAFVQWRREARMQSQRLFEQVDLALVEMRTLQEAVARIEARVDALSGQVEAGSRQPPVQSGMAARGYDLAARLAKRGSPIEEIVASCGITRHEAELLVRLHATRSALAQSASAASPQPAAHDLKSHGARPMPPQQAAAAEAPRPPAARKRGSLLSAVG